MKTRVLILTFLVSTIVAAWTVTGAQASREYSTQITYFSDAEHSEIIGEGFIDCQWHYTLLWGSSSSYTSESNDPCGNGGMGCWPECEQACQCYAGYCLPEC
jgi:hypothetical protein